MNKNQTIVLSALDFINDLLEQLVHTGKAGFTDDGRIEDIKRLAILSDELETLLYTLKED